MNFQEKIINSHASDGPPETPYRSIEQSEQPSIASDATTAKLISNKQESSQSQSQAISNVQLNPESDNTASNAEAGKEISLVDSTKNAVMKEGGSLVKSDSDLHSSIEEKKTLFTTTADEQPISVPRRSASNKAFFTASLRMTLPPIDETLDRAPMCSKRVQPIENVASVPITRASKMSYANPTHKY